MPQDPVVPTDTDDKPDYSRRRLHVIWYGSAVLVVLLSIVLIQAMG